MIYSDRSHAGKVLAGKLARFAGMEGLIVLALPRGGVPVAYEIAKALKAPMDLFLVRKLGAPQNPELGIGALASGGTLVVDPVLVAELGLSREDVAAIAAAESAELDRREALYRHARGPLDLEGKTVLLVDDGLATGSTMAAVVQAARKLEPARVIAAVPVASQSACAYVGRVADEVECGTIPEAFRGVGQSYRDFTQVSDNEVLSLLASNHPVP